MNNKGKLVRNERGFTLIELMMVIAVIGILAAVLVPKMGGIKDNAKLSGVDANVRQVEAQVYGLVERHKNDVFEFENALEKAVEDIENPFTGKTNQDEEDSAVVIRQAGLSGAGAKGKIHVHVRTNGKSIKEVIITPYDQDGKKITSSIVEIKP